MDFKLKKSNLNFRVYTATEPPETGNENDICVISSVPMKNWILSPDAPTGKPRNSGDVHIEYAVNRKDVFNALKNSAMMIEAVAAKQYVNGVWKSVNAMIYKNGVWTQFSFTFMATISVTYPAGSVCSCSDGMTTLTAPDTSGAWNCIVPNTGAWTVRITDGNESAEEVVEITTNGQSESLSLDYNFYLFKYGDVVKNTGGFVTAAIRTHNSWSAEIPTITKNSDGSWRFETSAFSNAGIVHTTNKINITGFNKLCFKGTISKQTDNVCGMEIWTKVDATGASNRVASVHSTTDGYAEINLTTIDNGEYYIVMPVIGGGYYIHMEKMWLE